MDKFDLILKAITDLEQRMNQRFDKIEQKLDVIQEQVALNTEQEAIVREIQDLVKQHDIDIRVIKKAISNQ